VNLPFTQVAPRIFQEFCHGKPQGCRIGLVGHGRLLIKGIVGGVRTPSRTPPSPDLPRGGGPKDVVRNVVMVKPQGFRIRLFGHVKFIVKELKEVSRFPPGLPPSSTSPEGEAQRMLSGMLSW
jgi:hypothetical protein